jgi:hypothetical protein
VFVFFLRRVFFDLRHRLSRSEHFPAVRASCEHSTDFALANTCCVRALPAPRGSRVRPACCRGPPTDTITLRTTLLLSALPRSASVTATAPPSVRRTPYYHTPTTVLRDAHLNLFLAHASAEKGSPVCRGTRATPGRTGDPRPVTHHALIFRPPGRLRSDGLEARLSA